MFKKKKKLIIFFKVFDLRIWIFIIVIISTAPSLVSILKMNDNPERGTHRIVSMILENYLQFWGIFCQQGLAGNAHWAIRKKYKNYVTFWLVIRLRVTSRRVNHGCRFGFLFLWFFSFPLRPRPAFLFLYPFFSRLWKGMKRKRSFEAKFRTFGNFNFFLYFFFSF